MSVYNAEKYLREVLDRDSEIKSSLISSSLSLTMALQIEQLKFWTAIYTRELFDEKTRKISALLLRSTKELQLPQANTLPAWMRMMSLFPRDLISKFST